MGYGNQSLKKDLFLLLFLTPLGVAASYFSVNIPHTQVFIEGRWIFGFMGFVLIRRFSLALLLPIVLSLSGFHFVPLSVAFLGNMLYGLPFCMCLRLLHYRILLPRVGNNFVYAAVWFIVVVIGYQLFTTPLTWFVRGILENRLSPGFVLSAYSSQPYFEESLGVALLSSLGMVINLMYQAISESRQHLRIILQSIGDAVIVTDKDGCIEMMNPIAESLTGWDLAEVRGKPVETVLRLVNAETERKCEDPVRKVMKYGRTVGLANHTILISKNGSRYPISDSGAPIHEPDGMISGVVMVFRDVSREYALQEQVRRELNEKKMLLQEVHHRVKNNLQIIASLIDLQFNEYKHDQVHRMMLECKRRITSMALVHNQLYDDGNFAEIEFRGYVEKLTRELIYTDELGKSISVEINIDNIFLGIDVAIPCGLILNELLLNTLQHAFPDRKRGLIRITMESPSAENLLLRYEDDGVGIPEEVDIENTKTLGLILIRSLTEQLKGRLRLEKAEGTRYTIEFAGKKPDAL